MCVCKCIYIFIGKMMINQWIWGVPYIFTWQSHLDPFCYPVHCGGSAQLLIQPLL